MPTLPEDVQKLIDTYKKAQADLIQAIADKEARGNVSWYQRTLLKKVNQILTDLNKEAKDWSKESIPQNYQKGIDEALSNLKQLGVDVSSPDAFSGIHEDAVKVLVANTTQDLIDANQFVGRQIQDAVRQAGIDAIANKVATGGTVKQAKNNLIQKLIDQGLNGIKDKRGRMINLSSYAETVARSTTREATNRATMNQLTGMKYDLVKMSSHATTCVLCAAYQGRVYSISGKDRDFPPLSRAFSGPYANIHPNCRHVLTPYIKEFNDVEADKEYSNRSYDIDERTQKQVDIYNKVQAEKRRLRNDRGQFERYRLALGKDAPKSFQGFMSMKRANGDNWKKLQEKYREISEKRDIIEKRVVKDCKTFEEFKLFIFNKYNVVVDDALKKLNFRALIESASGVEKVLDDFPIAKQHFAGFTSSKSGLMSCSFNGEVSYNPEYYSDYDKIKESSGSSNGFHPKNTGIYDNGTHEAGHLLELTLIKSNPSYTHRYYQQMAWKDCDESKKIVSESCKLAKKTNEGKGLLNGKLIAQISRYAQKDSSECMAEAISDYYRNGDDSAILSRTIYKLLKERLK